MGEGSDTDSAAPDAASPDATAPDAGVVDPSAGEPGVLDPSAGEPSAGEPGVVNPSAADPDAADSAETDPGPNDFELPTVRQMLLSQPLGFLLPTLGIGLGVASVPCFGFGFLVIPFASAALLGHAARMAGRDTRPLVMPGLLTLVLAVLLSLAASLGVFLSGGELALSVGAFTLGAALMGAGLSPLALAPIASACGTRGLFEPFVVATDVAGAERVGWFALKCAVIAVGVLAPVPIVAAGLGNLLFGQTGGLHIVVLACLVWLIAVPVSAATLTLHYARFSDAERSPTHLRAALTPVVAAAVIGLVALTASAAISVARIEHVTRVPQEGSIGTPVDTSPPRSPAHPFATLGYGGVIVGGVDGHRSVRLPPRWDAPGSGDRRCGQTRTMGDALEVRCDVGGSRFLVRVDPDGVPVSVDLGTRLRDAIQPVGVASLLLALGLFSLALLWLGRLGASIRRLSGPSVRLPGHVERSEDDAQITFEASDGERRVRVPRAQLEVAPGHVVRPGEAAILISDVPIEPMAFRTAHANCPREARLVLGSLEDALARRVRAARTVGFRLTVIALAALGAASVAVLLQL